MNISQAMTAMPWGREILRPWTGERNRRGYGWKRAFCRAGQAEAQCGAKPCGLRNVERLLARLGSVSEHVVKNAPYPVLVVKAG